MREIRQNEFFSLIQSCTAVAFLARWCPSCRRIRRRLKRMHIAFVDIEAEPLLAEAFRVFGVPVIIGFQNGREVARFSGSFTRRQLLKFLEKIKTLKVQP